MDENTRAKVTIEDVVQRLDRLQESFKVAQSLEAKRDAAQAQRDAEMDQIRKQFAQFMSVRSPEVLDPSGSGIASPTEHVQWTSASQSERWQGAIASNQSAQAQRDAEMPELRKLFARYMALVRPPDTPDPLRFRNLTPIEQAPLPVSQGNPTLTPRNPVAHQFIDEMCKASDSEEIEFTKDDDVTSDVEFTLGVETGSPYEANTELKLLKVEDVSSETEKLLNPNARKLLDEMPTKMVGKEINEITQLRSLLTGNFPIDRDRVLSLNRELGKAHAMSYDGDQLLCFDPGGECVLVVGEGLLREGVVSDSVQSVLEGLRFDRIFFIKFVPIECSGASLISLNHIKPSPVDCTDFPRFNLDHSLNMRRDALKEMGDCIDISIFDPGEECLMAARYGLLEESPKPVSDKLIPTKETFSSIAHKALDEMSAPMYGTNRKEEHPWVENRIELIVVRVGLISPFQSQPVFDPGGASMIFEVSISSGCLPISNVAGLLENSQKTVECSELLAFNLGRRLAVSKALCSSINIVTFAPPHLVEYLVGDRHQISAQCLVELLLYDSTLVSINVYGVPRGDLLMCVEPNLLILIGVDSAIYSLRMILSDLNGFGSLHDFGSSLPIVILDNFISIEIGNSVRHVFDLGGKEETSHELTLSILKLYMSLKLQQSAQNCDGGVVDKIAMLKQIAKGDQEDTNHVTSDLKPKRTWVLLLLDPPKEMMKESTDFDVRVWAISATYLVFDPGSNHSRDHLATAAASIQLLLGFLWIRPTDATPLIFDLGG